MAGGRRVKKGHNNGVGEIRKGIWGRPHKKGTTKGKARLSHIFGRERKLIFVVEVHSEESLPLTRDMLLAKKRLGSFRRRHRPKKRCQEKTAPENGKEQPG